MKHKALKMSCLFLPHTSMEQFSTIKPLYSKQVYIHSEQASHQLLNYL